MRRGMMAAWLLGLLGAMPLSAQETASPTAAPTASPDSQFCLFPHSTPASRPEASNPDEVGPVEAVPWQTVWGLAGLTSSGFEDRKSTRLNSSHT